MTLAEIVILAFAVGAIVDLWRNGSIFAIPRDAVDGWSDIYGMMSASAESEDARVPLGWKFRGFLGSLLGCDYCLSFHVGFWLLLGWAFAYPVCWPLTCALAAIRLAWLINGLLPLRLRYESHGR